MTNMSQVVWQKQDKQMTTQKNRVNNMGRKMNGDDAKQQEREIRWKGQKERKNQQREIGTGGLVTDCLGQPQTAELRSQESLFMHTQHLDRYINVQTHTTSSICKQQQAACTNRRSAQFHVSMCKVSASSISHSVQEIIVPLQKQNSAVTKHGFRGGGF